MQCTLVKVYHYHSFSLHYAKSSNRQGTRTAWVKPLVYFRRITCDRGTPLPVCATLLFRDPTPTRAILRACRAALACLAPKPKKWVTAVVLLVVNLAFFLDDATKSDTDVGESLRFSPEGDSKEREGLDSASNGDSDVLGTLACAAWTSSVLICSPKNK